MTAQTLTPSADVPDGGGLDITALLAAPTQTTLQFANTFRESLYIQSSSAGVTIAFNVGVTVLGQAVAAFTAVTLTSGHMYKFGRFHSQLDVPGTNTVSATLSGTSNVQVALISEVGVS